MPTHHGRLMGAANSKGNVRRCVSRVILVLLHVLFITGLLVDLRVNAVLTESQIFPYA